MKKNNKCIESVMTNRPIGKPTSGWLIAPVDVLMTNVLCFVGGRKEMLESLFDAPIMRNLPKEHINEIGGEIASTFDRRCCSVAGECCYYGDLQFIRLSSFTGSVDDICVLVHECLHIAENILRNMGIKEQENRTSEFLAYLQEFIFRTLIKKLYTKMGFVIDKVQDK